MGDTNNQVRCSVLSAPALPYPHAPRSPDAWSIWEDRFTAFLDAQATDSDAAHDRAHVERVVTTARRLARDENAQMDVVVPATWLHDCVALPKEAPNRGQASRLAADAARDFLEAEGYPERWIPEIEHAIAAHSYSGDVDPETTEARVVQDADRLDALGAVGLARCFMVSGALNLDLYDPDDPFCDDRTPDDDTYAIDHFYAKLLSSAPPGFMSTNTDRQTQVVEAVEEALRDVTVRFLEGPLLDAAIQIWRDFTDETDVSRTQKPETWAAALLYTIDRLQMGSNVSQEDTADLFDVSAQSVGTKYREIAETLDLMMADPDYLPEGLRRQIHRDLGRLPEEISLLENPQGTYWHVPFGYREDDAFQSAQDLVYDGWELLSGGAVEEAAERFDRALELDDLLADAHNGLANVATERGNWDTAEEHYQTAYELARDSLGTEAPGAFHWWGQLETRPYMRARQGLGWVYWNTGRYEEAAAEYEALLRRNPNDNQGARYVLGPLYQMAGDLDAALDAYDQYADDYPDDWGDPHHTFCWGLALFNDEQRKAALRRWREAIFQNIYVAPLLLDEPLPDPDVWHGTNLADPDHAAQYVALYGELWEDAPAARSALEALWTHSEVQDDVEQWIDISRELADIAGAARGGDETAQRRWRRLVNQRTSIEEGRLSNTTLRRILKRLP